MLLFEIGDTSMDVKWNTSGSESSAKFVLDGQEYFISAIHDKFENIPALEIYFTISKNGQPSLKMSGLMKNEFRVISIVSNAIKDHFSSEEIIWFSAKHGVDGQDVEHRAQVYSKISSRIARLTGYFKAQGKIGDDHIFILFKNEKYKDVVFSYLGIPNKD